MNRKFFLGLLAFSPIMILSISVAGSIYADTDPSEFWVQIYSLFVALVTLVFIINVPFNRHVENGKKGLWAALILFGNFGYCLSSGGFMCASHTTRIRLHCQKDEEVRSFRKARPEISLRQFGSGFEVHCNGCL